jgi:hypothetical protein
MLAIVGAVACRPSVPLASGQPVGPALPMVIGVFEDDYGGRHSVTATMWTQGASTRYHITRWVPEQQYFIAHNDPANASDGGKWTRIDWMPLSGMPPYEWAFCFSAYNAPTAAAAESTTVAKRDTPRTGCNGFPFSRMKRAAR